LLVLVAACLARLLRNAELKLLSVVPAAIALAVVLGYGRWRQTESIPPDDAPIVRIALIQGNSLADWKLDVAKQREIMDEYIRLSHEAVAKARQMSDGRPLDLVVWPETMFRVPLLSFDPAYVLPSYVTQTKEQLVAAGPESLARLAQNLNAPILVGVDRQHFGVNANSGPDDPMLPTAAFNSAALVDRDGKLIGTYDKVHLVMFGEYMPFAHWLPFLNRVTTLTGSVEAGAGPVPLILNNVVYSPNICYETVMPHVMRRQAATWLGGSLPPNILVNMTNDAWYWGSSELEQHLACSVFRAVETRRPLVIAANGGISAWIDAYGRVRAQGPKMESDVIIADVQMRTRGNTFYVATGDWFAGLCLIFCLALAVVAWRTRREVNPTFVIRHQ
jgi:apolipoprotein N-acyltransferase